MLFPKHENVSTACRFTSLSPYVPAPLCLRPYVVDRSPWHWKIKRNQINLSKILRSADAPYEAQFVYPNLCNAFLHI